MNDLSTRSDFRLVRIEQNETANRSDALDTLVERITAHDGYYPGISKWIDRKVIPGLRTGERIAYVGFEDEKPVLAAVMKRGEKTKFCHLSIQDGYQDKKYGTLLFALMAAEVRNVAKEIHFTLPEGLWKRQREFFQSFGFNEASIAREQYRLFEDELRCSAGFNEVWSQVVAKLPALLTSSTISGYGFNDGVVLTVRQPYAQAIMRGGKSVEVRRRFSKRWMGCRASVYASGGSGGLVGEVTIEDVVRGSPDEIWERFGSGMGCSFESFSEYVGPREQVFALRLANPRPYAAAVPLSQLAQMIGQDLLVPQSYCTSSGSDTWGRALAVAALLHRDWSASVGIRDLGGGDQEAGVGYVNPGGTVEKVQYALEL